MTRGTLLADVEPVAPSGKEHGDTGLVVSGIIIVILIGIGIVWVKRNA